jgi:hypothetical protein
VIGRAALQLGQQRVEHQLLHRLVAGERIVIVGREEGQIGDGAVRLDDNGRRKAAIDRQDRPLADAFQHHLGLRLVQHHQLVADLPALAEQSDSERDGHRLLGLCPGVGGTSWVSTRCARPSPGWWVMVARTFGVPAWPYQRRKAVRSSPVASSMASTKSSQVTACPSCRSK